MPTDKFFKVFVSCRKEESFDSDAGFELLPNERDDKRCLLVSNYRGNQRQDVPAASIQVGDVLFFDDGDGNRVEIGEVEMISTRASGLK